VSLTTQIYMITYNTNIHDHLQHKYTRSLTTHIYTTTYNTNIHDHLQHKYTRPLTTQIYTSTYNTYIHDHLQHKYMRPLTSQIYTTTYNTNIHDHSLFCIGTGASIKSKKKQITEKVVIMLIAWQRLESTFNIISYVSDTATYPWTVHNGTN
jgi:hypothetical protein